jgi:hypothetical protein
VVPPCSDRISRVPPYSRIFRPLRIRGYHPLWLHFPEHSAYLRKTTGLFRVRSPLLAESLLMSVPPGTEMFQFPGFASYHYGFMIRYLLRGGLPHSDIHGSTPARGSPWLFAACHVLHRLLVPRHPPNALIILDIPAAARKQRPHHAQKPSSGDSHQLAVVRCQKQPRPQPTTVQRQSWKYLLRTQHDPLTPGCVRSLARSSASRSDKIVHRASEPSPPTIGAPFSRTAIPVRHTADQRPAARPPQSSSETSDNRPPATDR